MAKLHEVLAAEKIPMGNWMAVLDETRKKFKTPATYFSGHTKTLHMLVESAENEAIEAQAREEKPVVTNVKDTLAYAFDLWAKAEDMQFQKNQANRQAVGAIQWGGKHLLEDVPVDELLGLEARLSLIKDLMVDMPTLDASKDWVMDPMIDVLVTINPDCTVKTEKTVVPVIMHEATKEHPAQVLAANKDVVVGKFTTHYRTGAATAQQKAETIQVVSQLLMEVKAARMRANCVEVPTKDKITQTLINVIMGPLS